MFEAPAERYRHFSEVPLILIAKLSVSRFHINAVAINHH